MSFCPFRACGAKLTNSFVNNDMQNPSMRDKND